MTSPDSPSHPPSETPPLPGGVGMDLFPLPAQDQESLGAPAGRGATRVDAKAHTGNEGQQMARVDASEDASLGIREDGEGVSDPGLSSVPDGKGRGGGQDAQRPLVPSWWPPLGLLAAAAMLCAMGLMMESIGLLIAAGCAVGLVGPARAGRAPMADGARGIAAAAPFALVGPLSWASVPAIDPTLCTDPGPALFLLLWPASVLAMAVGIAVVGQAARREGWSVPGASSLALWGLSGFCLALHLGMAGTWTCEAGPGSVLVAGFAAAWMIVAFVGSRRLDAQGRG